MHMSMAKAFTSLAVVCMIHGVQATKINLAEGMGMSEMVLETKFLC